MEPGGGKGHEGVRIEKGRCVGQGEVEEAAVQSRRPTRVSRENGRKTTVVFFVAAQ